MSVAQPSITSPPPNVLTEKDVNIVAVSPIADETNADTASAKSSSNNSCSVKSMEFHRQVLQSKMEEAKYDYQPQQIASHQPANNRVNNTATSTNPQHHHHATRSKQYISPSDDIMSPCTAKLTAFRNKQVGKVKPKSLFAQASAKKLGPSGGGASLFGSKSISSAPPNPAEEGSS